MTVLDNRGRNLTRQEKMMSTMIHGFILGWINTWTIQRLQDMIGQNMYPNFNYWYQHFSKMPMFVRIQAKVRDYYLKNQEKVMSFFSYEELLWQIEEHRQDLHPIANSVRGKVWFGNLIGELRKFFIQDIAGVR